MSVKTERLFSYGTLQTESVQLATFGRKLAGSKAWVYLNATKHKGLK